MKILITVASYYPVSGGVQMVTQYTAEEMVKQGHDVTVLTSTYDRSDFLSEHNGVKIIYTNLYKKADFSFGNKSGYIRQIKELSKEFDVLINVSLQTPTTDLLLPSLAKIKCKKVLYLHDIYDFKWKPDDFRSLYSIIKKCYYNISRGIFYSYAHNYIKNYDLITHLSPFDFSMKYVKKHSITQNLVLGNAAVDTIFSKKTTPNTTDKYFVCIANYNDRKNQLFVLRSFYKSEVDNSVGLVFIGKEINSYYRKLVKEKILLDKKYGTRNVVFHAGIPRNETEKILSEAYALVLGSKIEMFPVVIIEAMAAKIPFISTNVGCVKFQPGGFIAQDEEEMSYWMSFIINNPDVASCYAEAGFKYSTINMTVKSRVKLLLERIAQI